MDETPPRPPFDFRRSVPYLVLFSLLLVLFLSSALSQRPPEVRSIVPDEIRPGEELVINGRFFGHERDGGRVAVNGYSPPTSAYLSWSDRKISVLVPEEMPAGLLTVVTKHGESREVVPFTNVAHVPQPASGPLVPGQPYISGIEPTSGPPGTLVTITGINFGLDRGTARVEFAWIPGDGTKPLPDTGADVLPALEYNEDYVGWEDREVQVRVPDGASSGSMRVVTDKGGSNSVYFEVQDTVGTKLFTNKRIFHVQYGVTVADVATSGEPGRLRLWVPRLLQGPSQREVRLISREPEPLFDNYEGFTLYSFDDVRAGDHRQITQSFMLSAYEVETRINAARVISDYDTNNRLYRRFTVPDALTPSDDAGIVRIARSVMGNERNPYRKAAAAYNWLLGFLGYDEQSTDLLGALKSRKGDSSVYALLFTALLRASGVPARPVSGYVVSPDGQARKHMWAEFYLEQMGWVPVDPAMGDGLKFGDFPRVLNPASYYFGNMDSQHIIFSRGLTVLKPMDPRASVVMRRDAPGLQTIDEEYSGGITGYTAHWTELEILGVY